MKNKEQSRVQLAIRLASRMLDITDYDFSIWLMATMKLEEVDLIAILANKHSLAQARKLDSAFREALSQSENIRSLLLSACRCSGGEAQ